MKDRHFEVLVAVVLLIVCWSFSAVASEGTTRSAARQLGTEGVQAYQAGDYAVALDKLERAYAALPVPSLALWSARALERSGKLVEASERYLEAVRAEMSGDKEVQARAQQEATTERDALLPRIPSVLIHVEPANCKGLEIRLAGEPINPALLQTPLWANPGKVEIEARCQGKLAKETVTLEEARRAEVTLELSASGQANGKAPASTAGAAPEQRASRGRWQPVAGWVSVGLGGAGLVLGAVAGGMAVGKVEELGCDASGACPGADPGELAGANTLRDLSAVGFVAGGILTATGITLLLTAPPRSGSAYVAPFIMATSVGLRGAF